MVVVVVVVVVRLVVVVVVQYSIRNHNIQYESNIFRFGKIGRCTRGM